MQFIVFKTNENSLNYFVRPLKGVLIFFLRPFDGELDSF